MPYGPKRGFSDHILGRQARELATATVFAERIEHPLLYRIHINWSRTNLGGDRDGQANAGFRAKLTRWLQHPDQGIRRLYAIYVRERPNQDRSGPNDHFHIHLPEDLVERFEPAVGGLLPSTVHTLGRRAILIDRIGWTDAARDGALLYLLKGTAPKAAHDLGIDPKDQGRVYAKRCGVTETLGPAARRRHAQVQSALDDVARHAA